MLHHTASVPLTGMIHSGSNLTSPRLGGERPMATSRRITLATAVLLIAPLCVFAQAQSNPEQISVISFIGEINTASMAQLLMVVNAQTRSGVHKIRLVISSGGGDTTAAFAAYNYLHSLRDVEISTFNVGNVDSAAVVLYCAGQHRYSFPATRFLVHGNSLQIAGNASMDAVSLQGNLELLKNLNQMVVHVIAATANKEKQVDIENAVRGQVILTADEAIKWGLVNEIRTNFMEPGAVLVTVTPPSSPDIKPPIQFTSITPAAKSKSKN